MIATLIISMFIFNSYKFSVENCNNLKCDKNITLPTDVDKTLTKLQSCDTGMYPCTEPCIDCIIKANETPLYKNNCTSYQNVRGSPIKSQLIKFFKVKTDKNIIIDKCLLLQEQINGEDNFSIGQAYPELCQNIEHDPLCTDNQCKFVKGHDGVPSKCVPP